MIDAYLTLIMMSDNRYKPAAHRRSQLTLPVSLVDLFGLSSPT